MPYLEIVLNNGNAVYIKNVIQIYNERENTVTERSIADDLPFRQKILNKNIIGIGGKEVGVIPFHAVTQYRVVDKIPEEKTAEDELVNGLHKAGSHKRGRPPKIAEENQINKE